MNSPEEPVPGARALFQAMFRSAGKSEWVEESRAFLRNAEKLTPEIRSRLDNTICGMAFSHEVRRSEMELRTACCGDEILLAQVLKARESIIDGLAVIDKSSDKILAARIRVGDTKWINPLNDYFGTMLAMHERVAEIGSATEFLPSLRINGYAVAFRAIHFALRRLLPVVSQTQSEPPQSTETTTPGERARGIRLTEYDIWIRDRCIRLRGADFPIPDHWRDSLPGPDEPDFLEFAQRLERSRGDLYRSLQLRREKATETMTAAVLRDWMPLVLWRRSTKEALDAMKQPTGFARIKAFDQAVRALQLADTRL